MQKTIATLVALALVWMIVPNATAEAKTQQTDYLAGSGTIAIWCGSDPHPIHPYQPTEPWLDNPEGWLFSGEPECAGGDAYNAAREASGKDRRHAGYGGAAHAYGAADVGTLATATAKDKVFGDDAGYITVRTPGYDEDWNDLSTEGCGTQSIILGEPFGWWWPPQYPAYWWAFVDAAGVDPDTTVCFASVGTLHASWGA